MTERRVQERPSWCQDTSCIFKRRVLDSLCGGELKEPREHDGDVNTHSLCARPDERVDRYYLNVSDMDWVRWVLDALDGKETSWLSNRVDRGVDG